MTPEGELIARVGSERVETYLRSAAKPFQAMPLLLEGGVDRFSLTAADVALICASHGGTEAHVERVSDLLRRGGLAAETLQCGVHRPFDAAAAAALDQLAAVPTQLHNNCSGKHTGMLLTCCLLGLPLDDYLDVDHPLHQLVVRELAAVCGVEVGSIGVGVDGCSAPCYVTSLEAAARGYAALADPARTGLSAERVDALGTVAESMASAPEMVSAPGSFTTRLIEVTRGRVLAKEGAQGVYAAAVRGPVALGLVLKVADGGDRARPSVVLNLLRQLGSLSRAELAALEAFHNPVLKNRRDLEVGRVVADVELEEVSSDVGR